MNPAFGSYELKSVYPFRSVIHLCEKYLHRGEYGAGHRPKNPAPRACGTGDLPVQRSCEGRVTVSQAIEGFILHKNAQGLSQRTVSSYKDILEHWAARIGGDTQVPGITSQDLKRYLVWKTTE